MSHRSRKHRKQFACGHRGFGKYCHCCADRHALAQAKAATRKQRKQQRIKADEQDAIDLTHLPQAILKKARTILAALQQGTQYWQLSGKRFVMMHNAIKIPVTHRYRLLCRDDGDRITPVKILSHEAYNPLVRNPKRLLQTLSAKVKSFR